MFYYLFIYAIIIISQSKRLTYFNSFNSTEEIEMEIERKFLISKENLPANLDSYPHHNLEQGYLSTAPVVRIRKEDDNYYLTYKSKGLMTREEYNLPLTKESYEHMRPKADGPRMETFALNGIEILDEGQQASSVQQFGICGESHYSVTT